MGLCEEKVNKYKLSGCSISGNRITFHQDLWTISTKVISEVPYSMADAEIFWKGDNLLQRDPYEESLVEVRQSLMVGAGEGIFLRQEVEADTVVAFYNGIRPTDTDTEDWEACAYRIFMRKDDAEDDEEQEVLDIPRHLRDVSQYQATLAHKVNHSFRPNCRNVGTIVFQKVQIFI